LTFEFHKYIIAARNRGLRQVEEIIRHISFNLTDCQIQLIFHDRYKGSLSEGQKKHDKESSDEEANLLDIDIDEDEDDEERIIEQRRKKREELLKVGKTNFIL